MKVMALGAHPDDVELSCGGLVAKLSWIGHEVGIADLSCGELGSSGDRKTRIAESKKAAGILGLSWRECCGLPDGMLDSSNAQQVRIVVELVRRRKPSVVLAPYGRSRHPDHIEASRMVVRSLFLAGLKRFPAAGRPHPCGEILFYMGDLGFEPSLIVDIGKFFNKKMKAINAYRSQLERNRPDSYPTRLNEPGFLELIEARARYLGGVIKARYAEGFIHEGPLRVDDPVEVVAGIGRRRGRPRTPEV